MRCFAITPPLHDLTACAKGGLRSLSGTRDAAGDSGRGKIMRFGFCASGFIRSLVVALFLANALPVANSAAADDVLPRSNRLATNEITSAVIRSRAEEANRSKELDDVSRGTIHDLYQSALTHLARGDGEARDARAYQLRADQQRLRNLVAEKRQDWERLRTAEPWQTTTRERTRLESLLKEVDADLAKLKSQLASIENETANRTERRAELHRIIPVLRSQLDQLANDLDLAPDAAEHPLMTLARKTEMRTRKRLIEYQIGRCELELDAYDAEESFDLPRLQKLVLNRRIELSEGERKHLDERLKKVLAEQSEVAVARARDEFITSHPKLRPYAERNLELAKQAQKLTTDISTLEEAVRKTKTLNEEVDQKRKYVDDKSKLIGHSGAVGLLLRKTRAELPDVTQLRGNVSTRREQIDEISFKLLSYDEQLKLLANTNGLVQRIVAEVNATSPIQQVGFEEEPERIEFVVDEFGNRHRRMTQQKDPQQELTDAATYAVARQRKTLEDLKKKHNQVYKLMWELDAEERNLIRSVDEFTQYIDERVLWIRSGQALTPWSMNEASLRDLSVLKGSSWTSALRALRNDFRLYPETALFALVAFFVGLRINRSVGRRLRHASDEARRPTCQDLWLTSRVLALTFVRSLLFPVVPAYLGWRMMNAPTDTGFTTAVANGLLAVAFVGWPLRFVSLMCKREGLAESHLSWPRHSCDVIRRQLRWLMPTALTLLFVNVVMHETTRDASYSPLERILFICGMLVLAGFFRRVFRPFSGVLQEYAESEQKLWIEKLQALAYYSGLAVPLAFVVMSVLGYDYTARQLAWRLYATGWLAFSLLVLHGVMIRQIGLRHRKLSAHVLGSYERPVGADDLSRKYYSSAELTVQARYDSRAIELNRMMAQTAQFIQALGVFGFIAGCWMIWGDIAPALRSFDGWALWTVEVTNVVADGTTPLTREPITILHVAFATFLAATTWMAVKNLGGLLDFLLLERLPIDKSSRYAIKSLAGYCVTLGGMVAVFGSLGVSWSKVQWLATALTFGLAFGLQEVFANFVSGLIILFERPLRIGDVVTIGEVTGVVSNIRMRATTITNWERQEFIVPNKEFITGRLLNWTLSDQVNRISIETGVAYGSDVDQVRRLIMEIVQRHPHVLPDPAPTVTFESFGDSALVFKLRCFLPDMQQRLETINDLHTQIYKSLNANGIEIAFPQQDIHIRSMPEEFLKAFDRDKPTPKQEPPKPGTYSRVA